METCKVEHVHFIFQGDNVSTVCSTQSIHFPQWANFLYISSDHLLEETEESDSYYISHHHTQNPLRQLLLVMLKTMGKRDNSHIRTNYQRAFMAIKEVEHHTFLSHGSQDFLLRILVQLEGRYKELLVTPSFGLLPWN